MNYEHYLTLANDSQMWDKSLSFVFSDKGQFLEGVSKIRDARNEIAHIRTTLDENTWNLAENYMSRFKSQIELHNNPMHFEHMQSLLALKKINYNDTLTTI
jgi:hypothetical protein